MKKILSILAALSCSFGMCRDLNHYNPNELRGEFKFADFNKDTAKKGGRLNLLFHNNDKMFMLKPVFISVMSAVSLFYGYRKKQLLPLICGFVYGFGLAVSIN